MAKKFFSKALSVGLSLALCATMVAPAFAATFKDIQNAIDSTELTGKSEDGVVSWTTENDQRNVSLHDSVERAEGEGSINVSGKDITLNLNGNTLDGNGKDGSVITVTGGASLTVNGADATGKKGTITGGNSDEYGGGVDINGGSFTMKDGVITDNFATSGGGVSVVNGTLNLENVDVNKNTTDYNGKTGNGGGGISALKSDVTLKDVTVTDNEAKGVYNEEFEYFNGGFGGGIEINNCGSIEMDTVNVSGNTAFATGGGIDINSATEITMNNVTVTDNHAGAGGGGMYIENSTVEMKNTAVYDNDAYAVYNNKQANDLALDGWRGVVVESDPETSVEGKGTLDGWTNCWPRESEDAKLGHELELKGGVWLDAVSRWTTPEEDPNPNPGPGTDPDIEIEDPVVPLAGLFTRGDAIGYLWEQSGSPEAELSTFEDVPEDHQWAVAIGWAQDMGIARADEEGNFRPDDLVLRGVEDLEIDPEGELQEFLNWYAQYAGVELDEGELFIELEGALDDVIMGEEAQVIFDDFFARLAEALAAAAA